MRRPLRFGYCYSLLIFKNTIRQWQCIFAFSRSNDSGQWPFVSRLRFYQLRIHQHMQRVSECVLHRIYWFHSTELYVTRIDCDYSKYRSICMSNVLHKHHTHSQFYSVSCLSFVMNLYIHINITITISWKRFIFVISSFFPQFQLFRCLLRRTHRRTSERLKRSLI